MEVVRRGVRGLIGLAQSVWLRLAEGGAPRVKEQRWDSILDDPAW